MHALGQELRIIPAEKDDCDDRPFHTVQYRWVVWKSIDECFGFCQALLRVLPLRNFFLLPENYASCKSQLVQRFGELLRKACNPRNFKGQVRTADHLQAIHQLPTFTLKSISKLRNRQTSGASGLVKEGNACTCRSIEFVLCRRCGVLGAESV